MREWFPDRVIGFSSHHSGLLPHYIAYTLGARIFEVHFTLNRGDKGTDHGFSLEPQGLQHLCTDLRRISAMEGLKCRSLQPNRVGFVTKFGKSWYARHDVAEGDVIAVENLTLLAPAAGAQPYELHCIAGKRAKRALNALEPVKLDDVG
jgi:sialic acid synthase SpsE